MLSLTWSEVQSCWKRMGVVSMNLLKNLVRDESGATAIEYGLIAAIIGLGIVTSLGTLKTALSGLFNNVGNNLNAN